MSQGLLSTLIKQAKPGSASDVQKPSLLRRNVSKHTKTIRVEKHAGAAHNTSLHKKATDINALANVVASPFLTTLLLKSAAQQTHAHAALASEKKVYHAPSTAASATILSEIARAPERVAKQGIHGNVAANLQPLKAQRAPSQTTSLQADRPATEAIGAQKPVIDMQKSMIVKVAPVRGEPAGVLAKQNEGVAFLLLRQGKEGTQQRSAFTALQDLPTQGTKRHALASPLVAVNISAQVQRGLSQSVTKQANPLHVSSARAVTGKAVTPLLVQRTIPGISGMIASARAHVQKANQSTANAEIPSLQVQTQQMKSVKRLPKIVHTGVVLTRGAMNRMHAVSQPMHSTQRHGMVAVAMERPLQTAPVAFGFMQSGETVQGSPVAWSELGRFLQSRLSSTGANAQVTVQLTLHPAHLGQVNVIMDVRASQHVNVQLVAANADATQMMQTHRTELIQQLTQGGFASVNVDVRQDRERAPAHAERPLTVTKNRSPILAVTRAQSYQESIATGFYAEG